MLKLRLPGGTIECCGIYSELEQIQFSSVAQSCWTLCNPMACSIQGFPVTQKLPELAQTHVSRVSDAIQQSGNFRDLTETSHLCFVNSLLIY